MLPPPQTRANGPARTPLQTAGLCEPTTGQARWQGPSLLASTFLLKWSHRHLWLPQPPSLVSLVSLFEVMLYCTLEVLASPSTTRRLSSGRPWKADGSTGATTTRTGGMQREGKEGFSSSQPEGQRIPLDTIQRNEGQQRWGDGHQGRNQESLVSGSLFGTSDKSVNISGPVLSPVNWKGQTQMCR